MNEVYRHTVNYAREHDELSLYRESMRENIECRDAIEKTISENFDGSRLKNEIAGPILKQFGTQRVLYVLASTLDKRLWDGQITRNNKEWLSNIITIEEGDVRMSELCDPMSDWKIRSHSVLLNEFMNLIRKEMIEKSLTNGKSKPKSR